MNSLPLLKVCGMRDPQNIQDLLVLEPDFMGFIFYERSPRNAGTDLDRQLLKDFPKKVKKTGVFVNAPTRTVLEKVRQYELDLVQLHGEEPPEEVAQLKASGVSVIKAFPMGHPFDFQVLEPYKTLVDYFLFDTRSTQRGGSGKTFDWDLLKGYDQKVPFFLSGGIGPEHVGQLKTLEGMNLYALDINSRVELRPGLKDIKKVEALIRKLSSLKSRHMAG